MTELFVNWKTRHKVIFGVFVVLFGISILRALLTSLSIMLEDIEGNTPRLLGNIFGGIIGIVIVYYIINWFVNRKKK